MGYLAKSQVRVMENELRMLWRLSSRANEMARTGQHDAEEIADICDEADVLALATEWPRLRKAARGIFLCTAPGAQAVEVFI